MSIQKLIQMPDPSSHNEVNLPPISKIANFEKAPETSVHIQHSVEQMELVNGGDGGSGGANSAAYLVPRAPHQHRMYSSLPRLHDMESQPKISMTAPSLLNIQPDTQQLPPMHQRTLYHQIQRPQQINIQPNIISHQLNPEMQSPFLLNEPMNYLQLMSVMNISPGTSPIGDHSQLLPHQPLPHQQQQLQWLQTISIDPGLSLYPHQSHPHAQLVIDPAHHRHIELPLYHPRLDMNLYYGHPYLLNRFSLPPGKPLAKRRTKTGCLTCRDRRIKCDERKPFCFNCEKSKRVCFGYKNPAFVTQKSKRYRKDGDSNQTSNESSSAKDSCENTSGTTCPEIASIQPKLESTADNVGEDDYSY